MTTPEVLTSAQEAIQESTQQLTKLLAEVPPGPVKEELLALKKTCVRRATRNTRWYRTDPSTCALVLARFP